MCHEWVLCDLILSPPRAAKGLQVPEEFSGEEALGTFDVGLESTVEGSCAFCHVGYMTAVVRKGKVPLSRQAPEQIGTAPESWL